MKRLVEYFALALFVILGLVLGLSNPQMVTFNYYWGSFTLPLSLLLMIFLLLGLFLGFILDLGRVWRLSWQVFRKNRQLQKLR